MATRPAIDIDQLAVRLEDAFNASDAAALASLYSETAILMPPNEPIVSGRRAIQAWFEDVLPRVGRVVIVPIQTTLAGDHGFQVGTFTTSPKAGGTSSTTEMPGGVRTGKYVLLLQSGGGHWTIQYDIWSLDQPSG
jgi:ketosteroid isomerase-like protein